MACCRPIQLLPLLLTFSTVPPSRATESPRGAPVEAVLLTPVSSYSSKAGATVEAAMNAPVCLEGGGEIPAGAVLEGSLEKVHGVRLGILRETAAVWLSFEKLRLPDGHEYPIEARITGLTNARERIDRRGVIRGIRSTATVSGRVGQRLALFALKHAAFAPAFALEAEVMRFPDPEIELPGGAELQLDLKLPPSLGAPAVCTASRSLSEAEWRELHHLVDGLPDWSYSVRGNQAVDPITLAYIGSADQVSRAFRAAGWEGSRRNSVREGFQAVRAIAERQAFHDGPMRRLLVDGAPQELEFQRSLDTFERRDHVRVWASPQAVGGSGVLVSAATRDIAATFALHPFGFTHLIENNVDLERDEIVRDLAATGCIDYAAYVSRSQGVRASPEGYRKGILTDSRVAVVKLNGCGAPRTVAVDAEQRRRSRVVRVVRRATLTARNHLLRDNLAWRTAEAVRFAYRAFRGMRDERRAEALAKEAALAQADAVLFPPSHPVGAGE